MNLTQRQMQAFLAVARLRHFTRAAEQLHITQAGLSAMMKDLEAQLDCRLFDRTTRSVSLTEEGQQLVPVADRLVTELQAVRDAIHHVSFKARSVLTVGVTPMVAASVMPETAKAFAALHPEVALKVRDIDRQAIQDGVATGAIDVGFGAFFRPASGIERRPIAVFRLMQFSASARASTGKGSARLRKLRWADLGDEPLLALPRANPIQALIDEHLHRVGQGGRARTELENIQTLLAMAEAGLGSAILPSFVRPAARRLALAEHLLVEPEVPVSYYQITRKGKPPAPAVQALAQALQAALGGGPQDASPRQAKA